MTNWWPNWERLNRLPERSVTLKKTPSHEGVFTFIKKTTHYFLAAFFAVVFLAAAFLAGAAAGAFRSISSTAWPIFE